MENKNLFYQESLNINRLGLILSFGICLILGFFLGYVYSIVQFIMPFVYFNFIFTVCMGLAISIMNKLLNHFTHNRNKKSRIILVIFSAFIAYFFQWAVYIFIASTGKIPSLNEFLNNLYWIAHPGNFFYAILEINKVGMWGMFGGTFKGIALGIVWIMEAFIIFYIPIMMIIKKKVYPFSELLGKWYPKYTLQKDFEYTSATQKLLENLEIDPIDALEKLGKGDGFRHIKVHIYYVPEEGQQFITFEKIFIDKRNRGQTKREILINNFAINKKCADLILEKFSHKKGKLEIL
jgi:hypothetical protein